jgi:hypothetical protein
MRLVRCPGDFVTDANEGEACLGPTMVVLSGPDMSGLILTE